MTSGLPRQSGRLTSLLTSVLDGSVDAVRVLEANCGQKYRSAARRCLLLIIPSGFLLHEPLVGTTTIMKQPGVSS